MPSPLRGLPKSASLHSKLMLTLVLLITLAVAVITSVLIEKERDARFSELDERADRLVDMISHSMIYPVWNVDIPAIENQLTSLASDHEIVRCSITAVGYGELAAIVKPSGSLINPVERLQDIIFTTVETGSQKIGSVHIVLTRTLVEQDISEAHRTIWILVGSILAILYVATFFLLRRVVGVPVNQLKNMVDRIAQGDLEARCTVRSGDELGRFAERVNVMADQLYESDRKLRNSETRLKLVLEGSQLGYWDWNIEGGEVFRNPGWGEIFGYSSEEVDTSQKQWADVLDPEHRAYVLKSLRDHLNGYTSVYKVEYRIRTKEGQVKWILDQARIVSRNSQGKPLRMCGTCKDISDNKQAVLDREKLQNQLAQSQKMESVGQLAGGVAHDFNNMLSVILGYTELALDKITPSHPLFQSLREIYNAGMRSAGITKQLLAFARKQTIEPRILDLNKSVEEMLKMMRRLIGEDISLEWLPGENLCTVKIDPSQLDQIMANLCVNARDAIEGVGHLTVETGMVSFDEGYCQVHTGFIPGDFILLAVSDDGYGMNKETLNKIFEPFFTTKGIGEGTGLGLATVYGIVKQNRGFINVYSEPGLGTTFKIYFPVEKSTHKDLKLPSAGDGNIGGTETILMVEDDPMVLEMGQVMLENLGYTVLAADAPQAAIDLVKADSGRIDLIITDVIMQEMNGRELAIQLHDLNPDMKILYMSGYTADVIAQRGILDSDLSFLPKPFSIKELAVKVREVIDQKK